MGSRRELRDVRFGPFKGSYKGSIEFRVLGTPISP